MPKEINLMDRYARTVVANKYNQIVEENPELKDRKVGDIARMAVDQALVESKPDFRFASAIILHHTLQAINDITFGKVERK